jgi:hypothetical protein
MELLKGSVIQESEKYFIAINNGGEVVRIPISEDKPNDVKNAFNKLLVRLKDGVFEIQLEALGDDLFSQVAKEYIAQLNREIREIHGEMIQHGLAPSGSAGQ